MSPSHPQPVQEDRVDPMWMEAMLSWSPDGPGGRVPSPLFQPGAAWLPSGDHDGRGSQEAVFGPTDVGLEAVEDSGGGTLVRGMQTQPLGDGLGVAVLQRPASLLGLPPPAPAAPKPEQPPARRSSRLAAKGSASRGGAAKQASVLLEKRLADLAQPAFSSGGSAKDRLARLFAQPLQPEVLAALRALTGVEGKAQVNLPALGLSAEELTTLATEVAAV